MDRSGDGGGGLTATGLLCGYCGAQSSPTAKFCGECGARLTQATGSAAAQGYYWSRIQNPKPQVWNEEEFNTSLYGT